MKNDWKYDSKRHKEVLEQIQKSYDSGNPQRVMAKIDPNDANEMIELHKKGYSFRRIADYFWCSPSVVAQIIKGIYFKK